MDDAKDLLTGYQQIAEHLGWNKRQVEHRVTAGEIPTFNIGRTVCALRSKLDAHLVALQARADAEREALKAGRAE